MPRQTRALRTAQITDAALQLLADDGPRGLTAGRLAAAVGVSDTLLFRYFGTMEGLLDAAITRFEDELDGDLPLDRPPGSEALRTFFIARLERVRRRPHLMQLAYGDRLGDAAGAQVTERVRASVRRSLVFIRGCLAASQAAGQLPAVAPLDVALWAVTGVMRGAARAVSAAADVGAPIPPAHTVWAGLAALLRLDPAAPAGHR